MVDRHRPILTVLLVVALCALLLGAAGCGGDEAAEPAATEEAAPAEEGEHNVEPANAAEDAVGDLNEKIDDSTSDDP